MRLLTRISPRAWNRLLGGMLILLLLVLVAGLAYENSRFDAFVQGRINIDHAEISANGLTLAQAEADIARELNTDRADITALQKEVAALQAQDAQLEQEIAALQAELGVQQGSAAIPGHAPTAQSTPRPSLQPTPRPTPIVCVSILCIGAQHSSRCPGAVTHNFHC